MNEANDVYDHGVAGLPMERHISPRVLLEQEKERTQQLEAELAQAKFAGQVLAADGSIMVQGFQLTPSGLIAPEQVSYEAWENVGHLLFRLEGSIQWLIGDWLAYGMDLRYGDIPRIADALGRDPATLHSYKQMAQNIEYTRRRVGLTFAHHQEVRALSLQEQDYALLYAEEHRLNRSHFRQWIKEQFGKNKIPTLPAYGLTPVPKPALSRLEKLAQRDPLTYKQKDKAAILEYTAQVRAWLDDLDTKAKS